MGIDGRQTSPFSLIGIWQIRARRGRIVSLVSLIYYLDGVLRNKFLEFGARLEYKQYPLPGREEEKG